MVPTPISKDRFGDMPQQRPSNCLQLNNRENIRLPDAMRQSKNLTHGLDVKFEALLDDSQLKRFFMSKACLRACLNHEPIFNFMQNGMVVACFGSS